jgi:hypothetical protein
MAQTLIHRSDSTAWIHAVIGGSLSGFTVGIALLLLSFNQLLSSGLTFYLHLALALPGIILYTWLIGDPFARLLPPEEALVISQHMILLTLLAWFLLGFGLTYFIKSNEKTIVAWFSVVILLTILAVIFG